MQNDFFAVNADIEGPITAVAVSEQMLTKFNSLIQTRYTDYLKTNPTPPQNLINEIVLKTYIESAQGGVETEGIVLENSAFKLEPGVIVAIKTHKSDKSTCGPSGVATAPVLLFDTKSRNIGQVTLRVVCK